MARCCRGPAAVIHASSQIFLFRNCTANTPRSHKKVFRKTPLFKLFFHNGSIGRGRGGRIKTRLCCIAHTIRKERSRAKSLQVTHTKSETFSFFPLSLLFPWRFLSLRPSAKDSKTEEEEEEEDETGRRQKPSLSPLWRGILSGGGGGGGMKGRYWEEEARIGVWMD